MRGQSCSELKFKRIKKCLILNISGKIRIPTLNSSSIISLTTRRLIAVNFTFLCAKVTEFLLILFNGLLTELEIHMDGELGTLKECRCIEAEESSSDELVDRLQ